MNHIRDILNNEERPSPRNSSSPSPRLSESRTQTQISRDAIPAASESSNAGPAMDEEFEGEEEESVDVDRWIRGDRRFEPTALSHMSSPTVPSSLFYAHDLQLGAGVVIIQPSTNSVILLYSRKKERWFLPKGRKDVGESLEQTAVREGYEEVRSNCFCYSRLSLTFIFSQAIVATFCLSSYPTTAPPHPP